MILKIDKIEIPSKLSDIAYDALKKSLMETDLYDMPDEGRLDERELAERLGVSRTPLREAINRLVLEEFLKVIPRKGIFVVKKTKQEIIEILQARMALEGMAARLATRYVDEKDIASMRAVFDGFHPGNLKEKYIKYADANVGFHEMVLNTCRSGKLIELANSLFDHMRWIRFRAVTFEERLTQIHSEHLNIITALEEKDAALAEKRMREHIQGLADYIEDNVDFFD